MYIELESNGQNDGNNRKMVINGVDFSHQDEGIQFIEYNNKN